MCFMGPYKFIFTFIYLEFKLYTGKLTAPKMEIQGSGDGLCNQDFK